MIPREAWGAAPGSCATADWSLIKGIAVHHDTITAPTHHDAEPNGCFDRIRDIQRAHLMNPDEGYCDIAYNVWVCPHGAVFEARGLDHRSGANGSTAANRSYVAVCVAGNSPRPTLEVAAGIRGARAEVLSRKPSAVIVRPHSFFKPTHCPGDPLRDWISDRSYEEEDVPLTEAEWERLAGLINTAEKRIVGRLAFDNTYDGDSAGWGPELDKASLRRLRARLDAIEATVATGGTDPAAITEAVKVAQREGTGA